MYRYYFGLGTENIKFANVKLWTKIIPVDDFVLRYVNDVNFAKVSFQNKERKCDKKAG